MFWWPFEPPLTVRTTWNWDRYLKKMSIEALLLHIYGASFPKSLVFLQSQALWAIWLVTSVAEVWTPSCDSFLDLVWARSWIYLPLILPVVVQMTYSIEKNITYLSSWHSRNSLSWPNRTFGMFLAGSDWMQSWWVCSFGPRLSQVKVGVTLTRADGMGSRSHAGIDIKRVGVGVESHQAVAEQTKWWTHQRSQRIQVFSPKDLPIPNWVWAALARV